MSLFSKINNLNLRYTIFTVKNMVLKKKNKENTLYFIKSQFNKIGI